MIDAATQNPWIGIAALIVMALGSAGFGGLFAKWLDFKKGMRKQTDDISIQMVSQMSHRLETVERGAAEDRRLSAHERALCAAELRHSHHCIGNQAGTINSMLMLLSVAPEKTAEIVTMTREKIREDAKIEAIERAAIVHLRAALGLPLEEAPLPADAAQDAAGAGELGEAA